MTSKFDSLYSKIISEGIIKEEDQQMLQQKSTESFPLVYHATFWLGLGPGKNPDCRKVDPIKYIEGGGKKDRLKNATVAGVFEFDDFDKLDSSIADWVGGGVLDMSVETADGDIENDAKNHGIDLYSDSETRYEDYFRACIEDGDPSTITVHDYNEDYGELTKRGNRFVEFDYWRKGEEPKDVKKESMALPKD